MTTNIDKVREALAFAISAIRSGEGYSAECQRVFESAKSALTAHEAEVKELVEAVKRVMSLLDADIGGSPGSALEQLRAALAKVKP